MLQHMRGARKLLLYPQWVQHCFADCVDADPHAHSLLRAMMRVSPLVVALRVEFMMCGVYVCVCGIVRVVCVRVVYVYVCVCGFYEYVYVKLL